MTFPLVTVVVPARDEAADIEGCLGAIAAQDYPVNRLEVIVVDGASDDGTADVARRALGQWGFAATAVLVNEVGTTSSNLNVGLARAAGEVLCRVDARTRIEPHYVRTCVDVLTRRHDVAVVGGAQVALARDPTARARGIARALNNRWSMGGSRYRRSTTSGPSDTVYLGAFRTEQLREVRGWDERLVSNQDFDLNRRMAALGAVWFEATLRSGYLPRATFGELWRQYRRFGRAKVSYWRVTGTTPQRRQWALISLPLLGMACGGVLLSILPWPGRVALAAVAAAALAGIEGAGSDVPRGSAGAHVLGVWAVVIVGLGWLTGVVAGAADRSVSRLPAAGVGDPVERA